MVIRVSTPNLNYRLSLVWLGENVSANPMNHAAVVPLLYQPANCPDKHPRRIRKPIAPFSFNGYNLTPRGTYAGFYGVIPNLYFLLRAHIRFSICSGVMSAPPISDQSQS